MDAGSHVGLPAGTDGERCHLPLEGNEQASTPVLQRRVHAVVREYVLHEPQDLAEVHVRQVGVPGDTEERGRRHLQGGVDRHARRVDFRFGHHDHRDCLHWVSVPGVAAGRACPVS